MLRPRGSGWVFIPTAFPTLGQDRQVRVTTCRDHMIYDHMICATRGHVTFEPGEPTGGMARRARFRAFRANRRDGSTGSLSSISSQQEGWLDELENQPLYKQRRFPLWNLRLQLML